MTGTRTLGVLGTLVWDRIVPWGEDSRAVEDWGGIAYGLIAATAALPDGWVLRPLIRIGADLESSARAFLEGIPALDPSGLVGADEPNNRVELRYHSPAERTERLSGGVSGWPLDELLDRADGCDALLVNYISGYETTRAVASELRAAFAGPMFGDLHSLFLGENAEGTRTPRRLLDWPAWAACFDVVQMNEDEFARCGPSHGTSTEPDRDPLDGLDRSRDAPRLVCVTLAERGVDLYGALRSDGDPLDRIRSGRAPGPGGQTAFRNVTLDDLPIGADPTGCGDVWGAVMFSRLLAGDPVARAASAANRLAALNASESGVTAFAVRVRSSLDSTDEEAGDSNGPRA